VCGGYRDIDNPLNLAPKQVVVKPPGRIGASLLPLGESGLYLNTLEHTVCDTGVLNRTILGKKEKIPMGNQLKTTLLLAIMTAFIMVVGNLLGGRQGMIIALVLAAGMNFFSYWYSDKIVLKMYQAREATPQQAPDLYEMVQTLSRQAGLPMPKVYIIPKDAPNAFATGRNPENAVVAVTQGLMSLMNRQEIMGVLAHELAHVKNRDILIGTIAATMAGAIMMMASMARWSAIFGGGHRDNNNGGGMGAIGMIAMSILAPMAAMIIQMAVSRSREYLADATGAQIAGSPEGLARALEKLGSYSRRIPMDANPSTAHMFIVNPLSGKSLQSLFSTHPPVAERISRLRGVRPDISGPAPPPPPGNSNRQEAAGRAFWDKLNR
jgi:heat shock protein HtpX